MSNRRWPLAPLALIALVALISGCGSSAPAETASGGGANHTDANARKAVKFAECMRTNGVRQFPDPPAGKVTLDGIVNGSSLDPSTPAFKLALSACRNLEPAGFTGGKRSPRQMDAGRRFAQCVRANGVPDFPDPVNGQPLIDTNRIPSSNQPGGMTILNAATHKCGGVLRLAVGGQR